MQNRPCRQEIRGLDDDIYTILCFYLVMFLLFFIFGRESVVCCDKNLTPLSKKGLVWRRFIGILLLGNEVQKG